MFSSKIETGSVGRIKYVVVISVMIVAIALAMSSLLWSNSNAEEGTDIPVTSADMNENNEAYLSIMAFNLDYEDYLHIAYCVASNLDADMKLSNIRMLFWNAEQEEYVYGNHKYVVNINDPQGTSVIIGGKKLDNCALFLSNGISAKEIGDVLYARAYITDSEGNIYYSNVAKYSVLDYVYSRYRDMNMGENVTSEQMDLYNKILVYGANAQKIFEYRTDRLVNSHGVRIDTYGGYLSDGFRTGVYLNGDKVSFLANVDGFVRWEDSGGNTVSQNHSFSLTVTEQTESETYFAVYEDVARVTVFSGKLADSGAVSAAYSDGELFTITAKDRSESGHHFAYWQDERGNIAGESETLTLTAVKGTSKVYTAVYYSSSLVTVQNNSGTVDGAESGVYEYGESYSVNAVLPTEGEKIYVFDYWTKNGEIMKDVGASFTAVANGIDTVYEAFFKEYVDDRYNSVGDALDDNALEALKKMDNELFSEDVYLWLAELYDPESGAFYFSVSGKDNYGYLADIETTSQASGVLNRLGIGTLSTLLNAEQKAKLLSWVQTLQSNRDGYYYHPHWGISISDARRSRDYTYSSTLFKASGDLSFKLFNDANYRLSDGRLGEEGVTLFSEYGASSTKAAAMKTGLTSPLRVSVASAVSKVVLASASSESSVPSHLLSEKAFVDYLNTRWNSGCTVAGEHERHICITSGDNKCEIIQQEDDNSTTYTGSYTHMELTADGKVDYAEGRCNSCHTCEHTLGHSYSFGSTNGTQLSQIKAVGLGDVIVNYYYDIQEDVQASLRQKERAKYSDEAWGALTESEQSSILKGAENGLWEEEVTYGTISGLLKIYGTPGEFGKPFLYAEAAIKSALECALFSADNFISTGQSVVSIYNPYNAISGVLHNVNNYGGADKQQIIDRCLALIRKDSGELITNATDKLKIYKQFDGGFSYNKDGYCRTSQGQPVAVYDWKNGIGEGDVNGTALAFGTRGALLEILFWGKEASVGAPFSGANNYIKGGFDLNNDKDLDDSFDLDGDGVCEVFESTCTHSQRFMYLITTKAQIVKTEIVEEKFTYTFEDGVSGTLGTIKKENEADEDSNNILEIVDNSSTEEGVSSRFSEKRNVISSKDTYEISLRMKVISANDTTTHQIFIDGSSNILQFNLIYSSGSFTFKSIGSSSVELENKDTTTAKDPKYLSVNALDWFIIDIEIDKNGFNVGDTVYYGTFKVTQNGTTQTAYIPSLKNTEEISSIRLFSLKSAVTTTWYDDISIVNNVKRGLNDGEYHFDNEAQNIADSNTLVQNPVTSSYDKVYQMNGTEVRFGAYQYATNDYTATTVNYNFNSVQLGLLLKDAEDGDRIDLTMLDKPITEKDEESGKDVTTVRRITGIYLIVNVSEDGKKTVTFYGPDSNVLTEYIPRIKSVNGVDTYASEKRDMVLETDLSEWMTVKLEYHYDMDSPQLDITVRYADSARGGLYTATAASIVGVDVWDTGADAYSFENLSVNATGKIYLDDLYIRNVYHKYDCNGSHIYIEKAVSKYETKETENGHKVYYKSCQKCGSANTAETFVVHSFARVVEDAYKIADASIYSAATYYESCTVCHKMSSEPFTVGLPGYDESKYNFYESEEGTKAHPDYISSETTSDGTNTSSGNKWAVVKSENVGDAVNYYLNVGKKDAQYNHSVYFAYKLKEDEAVKDKYLYEFDFRWGGADNHLSDIIYLKIGVYDGKNFSSTAVTDNAGYGTFSASKAGDYVKYYGKTFKQGDWHAMKYLFERNAGGGWTVSVYIDGIEVDEFVYPNDEKNSGIYVDGIPFIRYELRYSNLESAPDKNNNVNIDLDRLNATAFSDNSHEYVDIIAQRFLVSSATTDSAAIYHKSCWICGESSEQTFTVGEPLSWTFSYGDNTVKDALPSVLISGNFAQGGVIPAEGLWARVTEETVGEAVNYYLNVGKQNDGSNTNTLTFKSVQTGGVKYIYEFKFRWNHASDIRESDPCTMIVKISAGGYNGSTLISNNYSGSSDVSGTYWQYYTKLTADSGWHTIRYEFTANSADDGWDYKILIDGAVMKSESVAGTDTPRVIFEPRYGTESDNTNISFDIDNIYEEVIK